MALEKLKLKFMDRALGFSLGSTQASNAWNTGTQWLSLSMDPVTAMAVSAVPAALYGIVIYKMVSKGSALLLNEGNGVYIDKPEKEAPLPKPVVP